MSAAPPRAAENECISASALKQISNIWHLTDVLWKFAGKQQEGFLFFVVAVHFCIKCLNINGDVYMW